MDLIKLKKMLMDGSLAPCFLVLRSPYGRICDQYVEAIAKLWGYEIKYLSDLSAHPALKPSLLSFDSNILYVYKTGKLDKKIDDKITESKNTIVICEDISSAMANDIKELTVNVPKVMPDHLIDYVSASCEGLSQAAAKRLVDLCGGDVDRLMGEVDKISIFDPADQLDITRELVRSNDLSNTSEATLFQLSNMILRRDSAGLIKELLSGVREGAVPLASILRKNFLTLLIVQMSPNATAEGLGISPKQLYAMRYNVNKYSNNQLLDINLFLCDFDKRLKMGMLDLTNERLTEYLVLRILSTR